MAFHVYPDPADTPETVAANADSPSIGVVELTTTSGGITSMFVTIALSAPVLAAAPAVIAAPAIRLSANAGAPVTITSVNGVDPTPVIANVYASVYDEGGGVRRVNILKLDPAAVTWAVVVHNNDAAPVRLTLVVGDSEAQARQSWVDVPATLDWDALVGDSLTGQDVPITAAIGNRGTGSLTLGLAAGTVGASDFEVLTVPGAIAPGTAGDLELVLHAPAAPGEQSGVDLDLDTNDPEAADATPEHAVVTELAASYGTLEVMLLLDASGSMGYRPDGIVPVSPSDARWAKLVSAAEQFLTLLGDYGDGLGRVGISIFPDITDSDFFPPTANSPTAAHLFAPAAISAASISDAIESLDVEDPPQPNGGATPMGHGIGFVMGQTAGSFGDYESSAAAKAHNRRIMVLMSDGKWNSGEHPSIYWRAAEGNGCADPGTAAAGRSFLDKGVRAITVAYGDPNVTAFEVDHALLSLIACKSGGTALDALADDAGLTLLETFRDALVEGLALDPSEDPGGVFHQGSPSLRRPVSVLAADEQVSFVVDWETERHGRLRLDLLTPGCDLISSADEVHPPGVTVHRHPRFLVITVDGSYLRNDADPDRPRHGEWTMVIGHSLGIEDSERYQYAILTRSRLRLRLSAGTTVFAGDTITLTADLRLDGAPVRDAAVRVLLDRPGASADNWLAAQPVTAAQLAEAKEDLGDPEATAIGIKAHALHGQRKFFDPLFQSGVLPMTPTAAGGWTAVLPDTATPGTSTFTVVATGDLDGVPFRREQRLQVRVGVRPDPAYTLVHVTYPFEQQETAVIRVWPRDRFGNVLLLDPDTDPTLGIEVAGAEPLTGVVTLNDGSYTRTVTVPGGGTPEVTVTAGGAVVVDGRPVPAPSGLHWADRVVDVDLGAEAEPGANRHADPAAVLGDPADPPRDYLALGAGGHVTLATGDEHVLARGDDDVNVVVEAGAALRSYRVLARQPRTGRWIELGTSAGVSASFSLHAAGLVSTPAVRVVDTSLDTREPDLSVSEAPGARPAGVGFRRVGPAPAGCLGLPLRWKDLLADLLRLLRGRGTRG